MDSHTLYYAPPVPDCLIPEFEWITDWLRPDFQGPRLEFDLKDVGVFSIPPALQTCHVTFLSFYAHLLLSEEIESSLNFNDLVRIRADWKVAAHPSFSILGWQSVAQDIHGNLFVPRLQCISGQHPIIYWLWLEYDFNPQYLGKLKNSRTPGS